VRLRQVALAAHDLDSATDALCDVLDVSIAYRDPGVAVFGLTNAVMPVGNEFLEVVCPVRADAPAGRYLARRGGDCGYMVMIQTASWEADRARAVAQGLRVVWTGELPDIRGMHLHPRDTGGALLSLDQPVPPDEWRWAGSDWRAHVRTERVSGLCSVTIGCGDPEAVAARWSDLLERKATPDARGVRIPLDGSYLRFVAASGPAEEGVVAVGLVVRDPGAVLAAARARGLSADAAGCSIAGTRFELEAPVD
jgi:hypothetical protein